MAAIRMLKVLGDRRDDCRHYAECLHAFVKSNWSARYASCPPGCRGYGGEAWGARYGALVKEDRTLYPHVPYIAPGRRTMEAT